MRNGAPIRVVWLLKELAVGGAERLLLELHGHLDGQVEFLPVAVSAENRSFQAAFQEAGFHPRFLRARHNADAAWIPRFRRLVTRLDPDVVHLHNPLPGTGGRMATVGSGVPVVYTEHSLWSFYHRLSRWTNAASLWRNDAVIAVSQAVRDSILASPFGRLVRDRLFVVPNGIDVEAVRQDAERLSTPHPGGGRPLYGTVGHLNHKKGIDVLLRAAPLVQEQVPEALGVVVGTGEQAAELDEMRRRWESPVELLGLRHDARGIMSQLDVFVIPSRVEGLPLALLEAMSLGRPIVATAVGGVPGVLTDGVDALLVPTERPDLLAAQIVRLLKDRRLAASLGEGARRRVEAFSSSETARRYADTYRWVLAKRAR